MGTFEGNKKVRPARETLSMEGPIHDDAVERRRLKKEKEGSITERVKTK